MFTLSSRLFALLVGVLVLLAMSAASASAAPSYFRLGSLFDQQFAGAGDGVAVHQQRAAVDHGSGRLYLTDDVGDQIRVFDATETGATEGTPFGFGDVTDPLGIAVDQETGAIYVSDNDGIVKYASPGVVDLSFTGPAVTGPLAFDQADDELVVADTAAKVVRHYTPTGAPSATRTSFDGSDGGSAFAGLQDLAVTASGDVVVVDSDGDPAQGTGTSRVERYSATGAHEQTYGPVDGAAMVAVIPATGEVVVSGNQDAVNDNSKPTLAIFDDMTPDTPVQQLQTDDSMIYSTIHGLAADDGPVARLYVIGDVDAAYGGGYGNVTVQLYQRPLPDAPNVTTRTPTYVSANSVRFAGTVDPNSFQTSYWVEYGTDAQYGSRFPVGHDSQAGDGFDPEAVALQVGGLQPGTTYHYRIVASNALGQRAGVDKTVVTDAATSSPGDGRSYEMVSPVSKGGTAIGQDNGANGVIGHASADGDQIFYSARGALSSADPGSYLRTAYSAQRTTSDWTSTGIDAPMLPISELEGGSTQYISKDGSHSVVLSTAVLASGAVAGVDNLYIRSMATGGYAFVATVPNADLPLLDATPDLSHFVFRSHGVLTSDAAPGVDNVYEWTDGHLRLVNRMPDGSVDPNGTTSELTLAKALVLMHDPHIVSADGSRILFELAGSGDEPVGLYMRKNGAETVPISASQRPGDPAGALPATLGGASADGNIVYFLSDRNLTSISDARSGFSLYRYDTTSGALSDLTVATDPGDATDGAAVLRVLNVSDDGASVYFVAAGNLAPGAVSGRVQIYRWHDGSIKLVGALDTRMTGEDRGPVNWSMSPSGRYFAFATYTNGTGLTGQDTSGPACQSSHPACLEVFVYDAQAEQLTCASCPRHDQAPSGDVRMGSLSNDGRFQYTRRFALDNGRVFFDSPDPLTADDTNGRMDVYEWRAGTQRLISPGNADTNAWFSDASATGDSVFFTTSQPLVGRDNDSIADLYVGRVGGGLPGQQRPSVSPQCDGDTCQGAVDTPPGGPAMATVTFAGPGMAMTAPRSSSAAKVSVSKPRAISGTSGSLKVKVPQKGRVTITGSGLNSAKRTAAKAGTYTIKLSLTARAKRTLRVRRTLRTSARVSFTRDSGAKSTVTVVLTFNTPATRKGR